MPLLFFLLHLIAGWGIVAHFPIVRSKGETLGLSFLIGAGLHTFMVFVMECVKIPLQTGYILAFLVVSAGLTHIDWQKSVEKWKDFTQEKWTMPLYEWPFVLAIASFWVLALWRAYYLPVVPYDAIVGMDLLAKYAVKEGHLVSSVFTAPFLPEWTQNQLFYAPFTTLMQVMGRSAGLMFGQWWLSLFFGAFLCVFYGKLRQFVHPIWAGLCTLLLIAIPEMYVYTYTLLTDYSSAVFWGLAILYLYDAEQDDFRDNTLLLSALLLTLSVWSRSDTILMAVAIGGYVCYLLQKEKGFAQALRPTALFMGLPLLAVILWHFFFIPFYIPKSPNALISPHVMEMGHFSYVLKEMIQLLIVKELFFYGYGLTFFFIVVAINAGFFPTYTPHTRMPWIKYLSYLTLALFLFTLLIEFEFLIVYFTSSQMEALKRVGFFLFLMTFLYELTYRPQYRTLLIAMLILFVTLALVAHIFTAATVENTLKRGFFRFFPIIYYYIAVSPLGEKVSEALKAKE